MEELIKELEGLVALEQELVRIEAIRSNVENNGMSKQLAMEAQTLIPGFNNNCPLAFYSPTPSFFAQHTAALEALSANVALALAAVCAALAVLIGKAIDYFFPSKASGGGSVAVFSDKHTYNGKTYDSFGKALHAREQDLMAGTKKISDEVDKVIDEALEDLAKRKAKRPELGDLDKLFQRAIEEKGEDAFIGRMLYADDAMTLDLIQQGPYCTAMSRSATSTGRMLKTWIQKLETTVEELTADYPAVMTQKDLIEIPEEIAKGMDAIFEMLKNENQHEDGVNSTNVRIEWAKAKMNEGVIPHRFKYSELHRKVEAGVSKLPLDQIREIFERCEVIMPELKAKLEKLSRGLESFEYKDKSDAQLEYQGRIHKAVAGLRFQVTEVVQFLAEFDRFGKHLRQIETRMFKLQSAAVDLIGEEVKKAGVVSSELTKLEQELKKKLANVKQVN